MNRELASTDIPLVDIIDRLLERGVVIAGSATISVAGVDLIELKLSVVLAAVTTFDRAEREFERAELAR